MKTSDVCGFVAIPQLFVCCAITSWAAQKDTAEMGVVAAVCWVVLAVLLATAAKDGE